MQDSPNTSKVYEFLRMNSPEFKRPKKNGNGSHLQIRPSSTSRRNEQGSHNFRALGSQLQASTA